MSTLLIFIIGMVSGAGLVAGKNSNGGADRKVYIREYFSSMPFDGDDRIWKHDY
ncbi:hypothetical protein [Chengkuizengella sediminis]|uniref:hypothetical protein n=1 Tax=Chengkuizengella sediminis TaxID=1885917 RepID=UPI0013898515|nr:hypothetical protein [Chengkuizengella sediminis]NDI36590.1 hypothetical protein [Chengkuizengella sediminis]